MEVTVVIKFTDSTVMSYVSGEHGNDEALKPLIKRESKLNEEIDNGIPLQSLKVKKVN